MTRPRRTEAGFTLIELLVALSVFSLAVMALLNLAGENTRTAGALSSRVLADIVAENQAVQVMTAPTPPTPGTTSGVESQGGRAWRWTRRTTPTQDAGILRVDVTVAAGERGGALARLTVFRGRP